jgi:hypothetical protein
MKKGKSIANKKSKTDFFAKHSSATGHGGVTDNVPKIKSGGRKPPKAPRSL